MPNKKQAYETAVTDMTEATKLHRRGVYSGPAYDRMTASVNAAKTHGYTPDQIEAEADRRLDA